MIPKRAQEIRSAFTSFFGERGHAVLPSASLIPRDPTVLFTVAGMVPFKPYFLGEETSPHPRAVTVQKCVRAGGKHNDLDEIGLTRRHLTFFEMLGNFSFGDYFKTEAIDWAWEFVTETLGFDPDRLWITVHLSDDEAAEIWRDVAGVSPDRIQRMDEDNYWRMADTGPCGPCSEIFFDKGPEFGPDGGPAHGGDERFLEFWNLVFMQYDQRPDGQVPLPKPSIDTGAGLERILTLIQGVESVFDIDEMAELVGEASAVTGAKLGAAEHSDVTLRILAEHARTMTFLISDGVFPSNEDRGYVLRRIMRRAIRRAYLLGVTDVVTPQLVDKVVDIMGTDYPDIADNHSFIRDVVAREEEGFRATLAQGSQILDDAIDRLGDDEPLAGDLAFLLHDTYGFPVEVTEETARERGVAVDRAGFDQHMESQRSRARQDFDARHRTAADVSSYASLVAEHGPTEFIGRDFDSAEAVVLAVTDDGIVLDRSPFYAEAGGQVGDTGTITSPTGRADVTDTTYVVPDLHLHHAKAIDGEIAPGQTVIAAIHADRRAAIRRNHTATHLLHWALKEVLGDHVKQQGSLVADDRLRFDFTHFEALTDEQIFEIERLANADILDNPATRNYETSMAEAMDAGAIAFFGDKYGDRVRVLEAGPHSIELCGGTHVRALGDIGPVKIVSEGSIGANIRRIEAVSGTRPVELLTEREEVMAETAERLGVPFDQLLVGADKRMAEIKSLRAELAELRQAASSDQSGDLAQQAVDGVVVASVEGVDRDQLRDLAIATRDRPGVVAVVLGGAPEGGGAALVAAVAPDCELNAGELIAEAAATIGGGGGRDAKLAIAGGRDPSRLDEALEQVRAAAGIGG
ncbi:MAG: alanine--tRNA ligase [Acidimicrobiia bacterium]|nr:alanine--tRNA ligase [bacterium]MXW58752.1 alanine--tRNA ligase [Acidimicrobiia bacterium]MYB11405.1 alanine--tRNA ligase [Acidimicrobiia bacterium]MYB74919.1 alanine--tRNA ligase [Acidimicrobiia bacterium]MYG58556.1 alanine--tRNA ligase [Acidimicrobiia bacterium]